MLVMVVVTTATTLPRDEMSSEIQPFHADFKIVRNGNSDINLDAPETLARSKRGFRRRFRKVLKKVGKAVVQKAIVEKVVLPAIGAVAG